MAALAFQYIANRFQAEIHTICIQSKLNSPNIIKHLWAAVLHIAIIYLVVTYFIYLFLQMVRDVIIMRAGVFHRATMTYLQCFCNDHLPSHNPFHYVYIRNYLCTCYHNWLCAGACICYVNVWVYKSKRFPCWIPCCIIRCVNVVLDGWIYSTFVKRHILGLGGV